MLTIKNFNQRLQPISNLTATAGKLQVTLTWSDPSDVSTKTWTSTKLVRKVGSAPSSSTDWTLILTETTRNQYSTSWYVDTWVIEDTTYNYAAFSVDSEGNEQISNIVNATPRGIIIHSDMQWPAPNKFHVPLKSEWEDVYGIWTALGGGEEDWTDFWIALKMPFAGQRSNINSDPSNQGQYGFYWSSSKRNATSAYQFYLLPTYIQWSNYSMPCIWFPIRCFKDSPVVPTSSWTKLYWTSIESWWIFWSSTDWLISLSSDWQNWITIMDKNLGATQVWNSGDTLSEDNCGWYFQRWNNYMFPFTWSVATSSTQVYANTYWPWNYYSSSTFITRSSSPYKWDSSDNSNLWWWVTQWTWTD